MDITNSPSGLAWETADELDSKLSKRLRDIRRRKKISQEQLSVQSGVSLGSIKRFEQKGEISLLSLTKITMALGCEDELMNLFTSTVYSSIQEVINEQKQET